MPLHPLPSSVARVRPGGVRRTGVLLDAAYVQRLSQIGRDNGLDHVGIAPASVFDRARSTLIQRKADGLADTMQFTYRNPRRSTDPTATLPTAQSLVVAARSYMIEQPPRPAGPMAAVARYAWVDHYESLRVGLRAVGAQLKADGYRAVVVADDNALVDRESAWLAGLGWFGKNANLLMPGVGSYFVLGCVITSAPLPALAEPLPDGCGTCQRCLDACPTHAIIAPGVVHAGRCLAWILQRPGIIPVQFRAALGDRLYGCDDCQTVCPPSVRSERRSAQPAVGPMDAWVPVLQLLAASDQELLDNYGRWYIADRNPVWLRRNALVVLGNIGDPTDGAVVGALKDYVAHAEPALRAHAVWAAAQLGLRSLLPRTDPDPDVQIELAAAVR